MQSGELATSVTGAARWAQAIARWPDAKLELRPCGARRQGNAEIAMRYRQR